MLNLSKFQGKRVLADSSGKNLRLKIIYVESHVMCSNCTHRQREDRFNFAKVTIIFSASGGCTCSITTLLIEMLLKVFLILLQQTHSSLSSEGFSLKNGHFSPFFFTKDDLRGKVYQTSQLNRGPISCSKQRQIFLFPHKGSSFITTLLCSVCYPWIYLYNEELQEEGAMMVVYLVVGQMYKSADNV